MEWLDEGLLLRIQPHGESNVIATFFTQYHGLATGYIRTNKKYPLQQGNIYCIKRKARLASHLGILNVEQHETFAPLIYAAFQSPIKLACINSIRTLLLSCLMEQDAHDHFYVNIKQNIHQICIHKKLENYVNFEETLLKHCGFGLDLTRCAVTNQKENLTYVSPKTGRAVTQEVGLPYANQLFLLPSVMSSAENDKKWSKQDVLNSLKITGHFLTRMLTDHLNRPLPPERDYLIQLIQNLKEKNDENN